MRRIFQFLLILIIAGLVLLCLYAAPPTRPWMETTLGPPLTAAFGGAWLTIRSSAPYQFLLANPYLILVVGIVIGVCPLSFPIIHGSFNTIRTRFVHSAARESGRMVMTEPISAPSPVTVSTPPPKEEPKPEPEATPEPEAPATEA